MVNPYNSSSQPSTHQPEAQNQSAFDTIANSELPTLPTDGPLPPDSLQELENLIDGMVNGKLGASTNETCIRIVILASLSKVHRAPILALKDHAARRVLDIYQKVSNFLCECDVGLADGGVLVAG
jgi:hypothetical protein